MLTLATQILWRKLLLIFAGSLALVYSIGVLWYVYSMPDIGLRSAFDTSVKRFEGELLDPVSGPSDIVPSQEDRIVKLGDKSVRTWPQLLQALNSLRGTEPAEIDKLPTSESFIRFKDNKDKSYVRVEFERAEAGNGQVVSYTKWCHVSSHLPEEWVPSVLWFFLKLGLFLVGALVFWKRPTDRTATQFFLLCIVTLSAYMGGFHWSRIASRLELILVFMLCSIMLPAVLLHFYTVFPRPKQILLRFPRWTLLAIYGLPIMFLATIVTTYFVVRTLDRGGYSDDYVNQALKVLRIEIYGYLGVASLWYLASVGCLCQSYRTATNATERNQVKWITFASVAALLPIGISLYLAVWRPNDFSAGGATWWMFAASLCFTLAFAISITRYRLMQLDQIVFHREKHQLDRTLRRMGQAIEQLVDPPTLAKRLLQASAEVLSVSRGSIYLREGKPPLYRLVDSLGLEPPLVELSSGCPLIEAVRARGAQVAQNGRSTISDPVQRQLLFLGGAVAQPLSHEGELLALLVLGSKELGQYSPEDLNLLAAFTQLTALALKSAERHRTIEALNRDLQTKVEKISEQQRRILALQSQLMRQSTAADPVPAATSAAGGIVGSSAVVQQLLQLVKKVSASQSAVLIRGESGTGKELVARALHENSPRAGKAFVKVNCSALSPGLLESELFGHVKGAFTGAHRDKVGRFELANGGTLFLDEIGDISLEVQTKLLRVIQEMTFERVGSSEPVQVDVRVIAATHQDLERLIADGRFREDLYYRLNVISVPVPPLRERREDIPELALHFMNLHAQRCSRAVLQIDDDALAILKAHSWPGNIRQLENVLERAVVVAEGPEISVADLPVELVEEVDNRAELVPAESGEDGHFTYRAVGLRGERDDRDRRERERLVRALATAKGNKAEAARALGLARSTLVSRLKKYGLS